MKPPVVGVSVPHVPVSPLQQVSEDEPDQVVDQAQECNEAQNHKDQHLQRDHLGQSLLAFGVVVLGVGVVGVVIDDEEEPVPVTVQVPAE